ncbi:MAG: trehalose-6-phosphate synthase [Phycisphaerales bacterium]
MPKSQRTKRVRRAGGRAAPRRARRPASIIVVANRLPLHRVGAGATARWESSAGGLVTAMAPVVKKHPSVWVGWPGGESRPRPFVHEGMRIRPVHVSREDVERYYNGMSNRTFWPLYHDAIRTPEFQQEWWERYVLVNQRFADAASRAGSKSDLFWVHDYHLQLAPAMIRAVRPHARIGFFLHIPFPPEELFEWLPWREEILRGLLGADIVGFQTHTAAQNFSRLCRDYTEAEGTDTELQYRGRTIHTGAFPISIEFDWFDSRARSAQTRERVSELRQRLGARRKVLLAIDRLDYTKGVLRRLQAFEELLESGRASAETCVFVQIATPSRESVADYSTLRDEVERAVGRINGKFSQPGRVAVHYFRRNLTREELIAYYAAADVMLVTPLRDGMNLVAKEYVACRTDESGVLVLSQFAGAAREMPRALIVNPRDQARFVDTIASAMTMPRAEARLRMSILRSRVKRHDVHTWCDEFLTELRR